MLSLARKSGWNSARIEQFDFSVHYCNFAVCRTSVLSYRRFVVQQGCCASATQAGAGACQRAGASNLRLLELTLAFVVQNCLCLCWPCASTHPFPSCTLIHAHCPHACSALASPTPAPMILMQQSIQRHLRP